VICSPPMGVEGVDIDLGDEGDSYTGSGAPAGFGNGVPGAGPIQGGQGNDQITLSPTAYERANGYINGDADGGPGDDVLTGVEGTNALDGGPGDDVLNGGGGDDRLLGGDGNDHVAAGSGADRVNGGAGDDVLTIDGHDFAVGGSGNDAVNLSGQQRASIVCGAGFDYVAGDTGSFPRPGPWLSRTCEQYLISFPVTKGVMQPPRPVAASRSGRLVFRIPCSLGTCRGRLSIRSDRAPFRLLASRRFTIRHSARVAIRLPRLAARRARARRTRLRARLELPGELQAPLGWRFGLRL
jgi:hypothetical protein